MSSPKDKEQGTPFLVPLNQGINLDTVPQNILPVDSGGGPHLTNTGILRDDGLTNLYETTSADSNGQYVMYAPNGKKISIDSSTDPGSIFVDGVKINGVPGRKCVSNRQFVPFGAIDVAFATSGNWLILTKTQNSAARRVFQIVEYNPTTGAVVGTKNLTQTYSYVIQDDACFVKTYQMTLANCDVASITFSGATVRVDVFVAGVLQTAFNAAGRPLSYMGITAFSRGGTYIVGGVPDNTSMPRSYYAASPYTTPWTAINETSFLCASTGFPFTTVPAATALDLIGVPSNISTANYTTFSTTIVISSVGVVTVTPDTVAGLTIVPADTYTGFGFVSGRYKSAAATRFSPYIVNRQGRSNQDQTVTDYAIKPQAINETQNLLGGGGGGLVYVATFNGKPTMTIFTDGPSSPACIISEFGDMRSDTPVTVWSSDSSTITNPVYVAVPTDHGWIVVSMIRNEFSISPISKDVVQLNDSRACIIDTAKGFAEYNRGADTNSFFGDFFLAGSNQLAWQTDGIYSNTPDQGILTNTAGVAAGFAGFGTTRLAITYRGATSSSGGSGIVFYQSATGTLFAVNKTILIGNCQIATDTTVAYVTNPNVPTPVDAIFNDGVTMLTFSALQTVSFSDADGFSQYYAGYTVANQYPVNYQFFNLFGQLYGFDGTKIFRMPVNGATADTPEQVAIATGLVFIANSPVTAWFWSAFDNTLFAFTGGASIDHWQAMTGVGLVSSGVFNVKENALYLQLNDATTLIFRDGLPQLFANAFATQTTYTTDSGVYFVSLSSPNTSKIWTYYAGSGTPITLTWQSGYYGFSQNRYCRMTQVVFAFKVADPSTTDIVVNFKALTDQAEISETATITGGTYVASPAGYVRLQYNPTQDFTYGFSVGIRCTKKVTLYEVTAYYTDGGVAPSQNRLP